MESGIHSVGFGGQQRNEFRTPTATESILPATVIGGTVNLVMRDISMTIDGHTFMAPVAWLQQSGEDVILLGREGVFELFDIEFKQAEETIVFKLRKN